MAKFKKHSPRAMQYAVKLYKKNGGKYLGAKNPKNGLVKFNEKTKNG